MKTISTSVKHFAVNAALSTLIFVLLLTGTSKITNASAELPGGLLFRVQTEINDSLINENEHTAFAPVHRNGDRNEVGVYTDFLRAQKAKNQLREKGFRQLEILAYFNKKKISLDDAFLLLNNKNASEEKSHTEISAQQIDSMLALCCPQKIYFAITIELDDAAAVNRFFELGKSMDVTVNSAGPQICVFGKYPTGADAEKVMHLLREKGFSKLAVTAQNQNGESVSLDRAYCLIPQIIPGDLADQQP